MPFQGGEEFQKPNFLYESMTLKWNYQRDKGFNLKKPSVGGAWIFSGTTQSSPTKCLPIQIWEGRGWGLIAWPFQKFVETRVLQESGNFASSDMSYIIPSLQFCEVHTVECNGPFDQCSCRKYPYPHHGENFMYAPLLPGNSIFWTKNIPPPLWTFH